MDGRRDGRRDGYLYIIDCLWQVVAFALRRRRSQGIGNEPRMERLRSPCEMRESWRQIGKDRSQFFAIGPDGSEEN